MTNVGTPPRATVYPAFGRFERKRIGYLIAPIISDLRSTDDWPRLEVPAALLLFDLLNALGVSLAEQEKALGADATLHLTMLVGIFSEGAEQ